LLTKRSWGTKVTIQLKTTKKVDQFLPWKHQVSNDDYIANNTHNTLHKTHTNDKNVGSSKIIPIDNQARESGLRIAPLMTFNQSSKGNIWMSP
jgi:hypothetical protein